VIWAIDAGLARRADRAVHRHYAPGVPARVHTAAAAAAAAGSRDLVHGCATGTQRLVPAPPPAGRRPVRSQHRQHRQQQQAAATPPMIPQGL
jgi:hypothetical protein